MYFSNTDSKYVGQVKNMEGLEELQKQKKGIFSTS